MCFVEILELFGLLVLEELMVKVGPTWSFNI